MSLEDVGGLRRNGFLPLSDITPTTLDDTLDAESYLDDFTMPALKRFYDEHIVGQERAKKAMAQIVYSTYEYENGVSTNLFIGPPGSGKSELIRVTCAEFPKTTHVWDMSMVQGSGWKGVSIDQLAKEIPNDGRKHIVFMDEFCKIINQRNTEVSYHLVLQGNLLRMFEHDKSMFQGCSPENITFIAFGAFDDIYAKKKTRKKHIGFSCAPVEESPEHIEITAEDLEGLGFMSQLCSRFDRIITLDEPDYALYRSLAEKVVPKLEAMMERPITVNPEVLDALAKEALSVSAGSRLIRSRLRVLCEDFLFDNPYARSIDLDVRPAMDM